MTTVILKNSEETNILREENKRLRDENKTLKKSIRWARMILNNIGGIPKELVDEGIELKKQEEENDTH